MFWSIDPWGEQRADQRAANIAWASVQPHSRAKIDAASFLLYPDEMHDVPENADAEERALMMKLSRLAG